MSKVYDCFTFFNEFDLLEIRLNVLNEVVDNFVLVEMAYTFQRKEKPLYFEENKQRFEKFKDKIIHIKITEVPEEIPSKFCNDSRWQLQCFQRDAIIEGLKDASDDDIIMVSDLDEIPNPKAVEDYASRGSGITVFEQKMMYYFINNINITAPVWENGTRISSFRELKNPGSIPVREEKHWEFSKVGSCNYFRYCLGKHVKNAGWHFSYCGGVDAILQKRRSISEQCFNTNENMSAEQILNKIYIGKDILDRKEYCYKCLKIDDSFPKYIRDNQERYASLILHQTFLQSFKNSFVIINCRIYVAKLTFFKKIKQIEKIIRKILSPLKKLLFKVFRR